MQTESANGFPAGNGTPTPRRFSDFAKPAGLDGTKVKIEDILNKEILILGYKLRDSKYPNSNSRDCATVQFSIPDTPGEKYIFFTGSSVLRDQLEEYKEQLPFYTTVKKIDRYYSFT